MVPVHRHFPSLSSSHHPSSVRPASYTHSSVLHSFLIHFHSYRHLSSTDQPISLNLINNPPAPCVSLRSSFSFCLRWPSRHRSWAALIFPVLDSRFPRRSAMSPPSAALSLLAALRPHRSRPPRCLTRPRCATTPQLRPPLRALLFCPSMSPPPAVAFP